MLRTCQRMIPLILVLTGFLPGVKAAALDAGYLTGKWEVNAQGVCGGKKAEHLLLRGNSTFEYGRRGKAEAVGFWRIEDDVVAFEMLSMPASFQDIHAELKLFNGYEIYRMQVMPIDVQQDRISAVAGIGDLMERLILQRCR